MSSPTETDLLERLIAAEAARFLARSPRAAEADRRAREHLAGGVTSSLQIAHPRPIWVSHGIGSRLFDLDGNEYVDLHLGYGALVVGHAHPAVVAAVGERLTRGSHFAQPTPEVSDVAEELSSRFGLPSWRFGSSGTEATMDAIHLMRSLTGRDLIVKMEGAYHGHHDSVREGPGVPEAMSRLTIQVRWNQTDDIDRVFGASGDLIAGLLIEPVQTSAGLIPPDPGFLEHVHSLTRHHGALLGFDEVKTGLTIGPGGATGLLGVEPDLVCLAKSLAGGLPAGVVGGSASVMNEIASGRYLQLGTFNGNPLSMAATRATLCEVLDQEAYLRLERLGKRIETGLQRSIAQWDLPAQLVAIGARGSLVFRAAPVREYRDFLEVDPRYHQGGWLYLYNRGVMLLPWGRGLQWLLSVQHDEDDADRFIEVFGAFAEALRS